MSDREEFEKWLIEVHGLNAEWDEDRDCYVEFACHIAWKAWQAARNMEPVAEVRKFGYGMHRTTVHHMDSLEKYPDGTKLYVRDEQ